MPVKNILIFALFAAFMISWSLIDPPGWIIVFTPALIRAFIPSVNGKKASDAAIEFLIFEDWNFFAFWTAMLQLSNLLGCPAPIPIVVKLLHKTIALDFTCLQTLKANCISAMSFFFGFNLVTHFNFFLSIITLFLLCIRKDPSKNLIEVGFVGLNLEISIILKFFFFF